MEDRALRYIAKVADGSMRDALSLLDQCIAFHLGKELTYDMTLDVLGAVDTEVFSRLLRFVMDRNVLGCIELLEEIVMQGRELVQFVTDFTWYLLRVHQFLHAIRDGINGDSFKIISLAAGQDRNGDLVHLCGRQNKNNIRWRLFQRF